MNAIREVMHRDPVCCTPEDPVADCARLMEMEDVGVIPVVESLHTRRVVGMVTDRDLCLGVLAEGRDPTRTVVGDCMTDEVITASVDDTLAEARRTMEQKQIRWLCVVDENFCCVGLLAEADAERAFRRRAGSPARAT